MKKEVLVLTVIDDSNVEVINKQGEILACLNIVSDEEWWAYGNNRVPTQEVEIKNIYIVPTKEQFGIKFERVEEPFYNHCINKDIVLYIPERYRVLNDTNYKIINEWENYTDNLKEEVDPTRRRIEIYEKAFKA